MHKDFTKENTKKMSQFSIAYKLTGINESGYSNNKEDAGGETWNGIARNYWKDWEGWRVIDFQKQLPGFPANISSVKDKLAPLEEDFFKVNFWDKCRCGEINNQDIANELYDTAVNFGTQRAISMAQEACNLLNKNGKDYEDIEVDGKIGSKTLSAINNHKYKDALFNTMNILQGEAYIKNCRANPKKEIFFRGWLSRVVIKKI